MSLGNNWTTYLTDDKGQKVTNRKKINEVATLFYKKLYDLGDVERNEESTHELLNSEEDNVPKFVEEEIRNAIKNLKETKRRAMTR